MNTPTTTTNQDAQIAEYWADWLVDAVAGATQDPRFLRGDPHEDRIATGAILANGRKAITNALTKLREQVAASTPVASAEETPAVRDRDDAAIRMVKVWQQLCRRAVNEAKELTNYVEDRPGLRRAEQRIEALEREAREAIAAATDSAAVMTTPTTAEQLSWRLVENAIEAFALERKRLTELGQDRMSVVPLNEARETLVASIQNYVCAAVARLEAANTPAVCSECHGDGYITVPVCCGHGRGGECCLDPEPSQEPCPTCTPTSSTTEG